MPLSHQFLGSYDTERVVFFFDGKNYRDGSKKRIRN